MALLKIERETVINFNDEEDSAYIYTENHALKRKLDKLCDSNIGYSRVRETTEGAEYACPKELIGFKKPRRLSDEKRAELAERGRMNFANKNKGRV